MNSTVTQLSDIKLVGISARTSNQAEMNPETAKIATTMQHFFSKNLQEKIKNRKNPGRIFAVYTEYENDSNGAYTYFLGEEVSDFDIIDPELKCITLPAQSYKKFTSDPGVMPRVVIDLWLKIWDMTEEEIGGKRAYLADFEVYDERSKDPNNAVLDIYLGILA